MPTEVHYYLCRVCSRAYPTWEMAAECEASDHSNVWIGGDE
jgi:hypothetical protein